MTITQTPPTGYTPGLTAPGVCGFDSHTAALTQTGRHRRDGVRSLCRPAGTGQIADAVCRLPTTPQRADTAYRATHCHTHRSTTTWSVGSSDIATRSSCSSISNIAPLGSSQRHGSCHDIVFGSIPCVFDIGSDARFGVRIPDSPLSTGYRTPVSPRKVMTGPACDARIHSPMTTRETTKRRSPSPKAVTPYDSIANKHVATGDT